MTANRAFIWVAACALLGSVWCTSPVMAQRPRAVIVDTDAGPDDLMAIAYLLAHPAVRIEAVTISYGLAHPAAGARNILRLLDSAGRTTVPVFVGRDTPRGAYHPYPPEWRTLSDQLTGVSLPVSTRTTERRSAVDFLVERLRDASRPVDVLALGAHTNLAEALDRSASLPAIHELVIMGGAVNVPGNLGDGVKSNTTSEWNLYSDPPAARRVLASGLPLLLVPLDATNDVRVDAGFVRAVQQTATTPLGRIVSEVLATAAERITAGAYYAWDPLAAVALVDRTVIRSERLPISVRLSQTEDGRTMRDAQGRAIEVATGANRAQFLERFVTALSRH